MIPIKKDHRAFGIIGSICSLFKGEKESGIILIAKQEEGSQI